MSASILTPDPHGIWSPAEFKYHLEKALDKALSEARQGRVAADRRDRRAAARRLAAEVQVEEHRLQATPSIQIADWYSDAPKATGEVQDTTPDESDPWLRQAAKMLAGGASEREVERFTGYSADEADAVAWRTLDEMLADEDTVAYLNRDDRPAPKGYGMTQSELRRQWTMNARLRYRDMLTEALRRHRGLAPAKVNEFPAMKAEAQLARSVQWKWRFTDELARHGVYMPDKDTVVKLKKALSASERRPHGSYEVAFEVLQERRLAAEAGTVDRYRHELV